MRKFKIIRRLGDNELTPSNWWGLCWYEDYDNVRVIAPIPLNLVVVLARWLHSFLAYKWSQKLLRGAQLSRRQHSRAVKRLCEIAMALELKRGYTGVKSATGEPAIETFAHADAPLIDYLLNVLDHERIKAGRSVKPSPL